MNMFFWICANDIEYSHVIYIYIYMQVDFYLFCRFLNKQNKQISKWNIDFFGFFINGCSHNHCFKNVLKQFWH
jgi:hypothetical protein